MCQGNGRELKETGAVRSVKEEGRKEEAIEITKRSVRERGEVVRRERRKAGGRATRRLKRNKKVGREKM